MSREKRSKELINELAILLGVAPHQGDAFTKMFTELIEINSNLDPHPKQLYVIGQDTKLGTKIADLLESEPAPFEITYFSDGEVQPHQTTTVAERDVYIICTSQKGADMAKWKDIYLTFVRNIRWGRPYKVTVILPEWYGQRADVEDFPNRKARLSNSYADLLKSAGVDRIVVCKLHNAASSTDNPPMINIDTTTLITKQLQKEYSDLSMLAIGSADMGGAKYARSIASTLGVPVIITDKQRDPKKGKSKTYNAYDDGNIHQNITTIVFVDDLIQTFNSLKDAAVVVREKFPHIVNYICVATHADFVESTLGNIRESIFATLWVTDTVPVGEDFLSAVRASGKEIKFMSVAKLVAQVIDNLHNNVPVSDLWINGNAE